MAFDPGEKIQFIVKIYCIFLEIVIEMMLNSSVNVTTVLYHEHVAVIYWRAIKSKLN